MEIEESNITINQRALVIYQAEIIQLQTNTLKLESICKISER